MDLIESLAALTYEDAYAIFQAASDLRRNQAVAASLPDPETACAHIYVDITKADAFEGIIYGTASEANRFDNQNDLIEPAELRRAAHAFFARADQRFLDTHDFGELPGRLVESWFDERTGKWNIAYRPDDIEVAKAAARGDYVGFSIGGTAKRVPL